MGMTEENARGKTVLMLAGAGGLGSIGTQLCKNILSMTVIATASRPESIEWCKHMGADFVINHRENIAEQLKQIGHPTVDAILMLCTPDQYFAESCAWIKPFGKIGLAVDNKQPVDIKGTQLVDGHLHKCITFYWEFMFARPKYGIQVELQGKYLKFLAECFDQGKLKPYDSVILDFSQLKAAHKKQDSGHTCGKIVLKMPALEPAQSSS